MAKRMLGILLVLAMLAAMLVVPVSGEKATEDAGTTALTETCPCGCGEAMTQVEWEPYDPNSGGLLPGHFYLDGDYIQKDQYTVSSDSRIVLDLRGHTLTTKGSDRLYLIYGYMAVLDSVGGGKMCSKTSGTDNGGVILMGYSASDSDEKAVFELYSGTITVDPASKGAERGGIASIGQYATFRMYGGMVMNGTSQGTTEGSNGGCLALSTSSATLDVRGGTIVGGKSPAYGGNIYSANGTVSLKDCSVIGGNSTSRGGNIYATGGSLTIENCVISDGVAGDSYGGGNICTVSGTAVTIRDTVIRNGYSAKTGGNVYFGTGEQLLENTTITGGVSATRAGNLYISGNSVTTLNSCTIPGDVYCTGTLTLKGATRIGLHNNGLNLINSDGETKAVNAAGLTEGAEIYVNAGALFTDSAAKVEYFKPALRTVITESSEGLVGAQAADGEIAGYCPHCQERVSWKAFTNVVVQECLKDSASDSNAACTKNHMENGHYYLTQDYSSVSRYYAGINLDNVIDVKDTVVDLNGYSITGTGRAFYAYKGCTLTLLDSVGGAVVSGKGTDDQGGSTIYNQGGKLNIRGGKYVMLTGKAVRNGGVVSSSSGTVNISGGIFDGTAYENTSYYGGALYQSGSTKMTISGGCFLGGTTARGGAFYVDAGGKTTITGGQFHGSTATYGGCLYAYGKSSDNDGSITISGASFVGGNATTSGGNIYATYFNVQITDCYIARGTASENGGNVVVSHSPDGARYENCLMILGSAQQGGNLYSSSPKTKLQLVDCTILEGAATGNGGNIALVDGNVEISGCTVAYGNAGAEGGNIYVASGSNTEAPDNKLVLKDGTMLANGVATGNGGNLHVFGVAELQNVFVNNGKAALGQDLYLAEGTELTNLVVGAEATGTVLMAVDASRLGQNVYGEPVSGTQAQTLSMGITLEGDYGQPQLCANDGVLTVASAEAGGMWYATAAEAVANSGPDQVVTLHTGTTLTINGNCTVDINGNALTVAGTGTLYGMDSSGKGGVLPTGKVTVTEKVTVAEYTRAENQIYVSNIQGGEATFHHLDMAITGVAIRPSVAGIYYTGTWRFDTVLAQKLDTCGVTVSAVAEPTDTFKTDGTALWTAFNANEITSGESKTGAIVSGILKTEGRTEQENDVYGKTPIFAATYAVLDSGTTITGTPVKHSLYTVMTQLEALIVADPNRYSCLQLPARRFYETWKDFGMGNWEFTKIPGKADNGKLDILFIGNSFTWYGKCVLDKGNNVWGLEKRVNDQGYFYQICKSNGLEANVTNFTFGGHGLSDWYSQSCSANRGHDGLDHLAYLTDRDYDVVVIQPGSGNAGSTDLLGPCQKIMAIFQEVNPDTQFVLLSHHRVHLGNAAFKANIKDVAAAGVLVVDWGLLVADVINGVVEVPGATQEYNQNSFVIRKSESDGYHENMLSGYITAQMLYCALTGESAVGQDYSFCGDKTINAAFDFEKFLKEEYRYDPGNSNFIEIFNSEADMRGLQQLIDQYLEAKAYLYY